MTLLEFCVYNSGRTSMHKLSCVTLWVGQALYCALLWLTDLVEGNSRLSDEEEDCSAYGS